MAENSNNPAEKGQEVTESQPKNLEKLSDEPVGSVSQEDQSKIGQDLQEQRVKIEGAEVKELLGDVSQTVEHINKIESELEAQQKEEEKLQKKTLGFLGKMFLGIAILAGGRATYERVRVGVKEREERQTIEQNIGFDLKEVAERNGFKAELQVDNKDGKYIIHVGQRHDIRRHDDNPVEREITIKCQENIEKLILELQEQNKVDTTVYLEGFTRESVDKLKEIERMYSVNKTSTFTYAAFVYDLDKGLREKSENIRHSSAANYYYLSRIVKMESEESIKNPSLDVETILKDFVNYRESHPEVKDGDYLKEHPELEEAILLKEARDKIESLRSEGLLEKATNGIRYFGGAEKLYIDGRISAQGAEDRKVLDELYLLEKDPTENQEKIEKMVMTERENAAVGIVSLDTKDSKYQSTILVYGRAHDFTDNVKEHNKDNPENKLGLIKVSPKKLINKSK